MAAEPRAGTTNFHAMSVPKRLSAFFAKCSFHSIVYSLCLLACIPVEQFLFGSTLLFTLEAGCLRFIKYLILSDFDVGNFLVAS
jgi:hypothetical protein